MCEAYCKPREAMFNQLTQYWCECGDCKPITILHVTLGQKVCLYEKSTKKSGEKSCSGLNQRRFSFILSELSDETT